MKIVKLNRINTVLAEIDKQGKWLAQNLAKAQQRFPNGVPIPFSLT